MEEDVIIVIWRKSDVWCRGGGGCEARGYLATHTASLTFRRPVVVVNRSILDP